MEKALDSAARATETDTKKMSEAFRKSGDKISREMHDTSKDVKKESGEMGKEAGGELLANLGEQVGSGQANLQDTVLGTIGGLVPAMGPAGAAVGVALMGAAGLLGYIDSQNKKIKEAGMAVFEALRSGVLDQATKEGLLQDVLGVDNMFDAMSAVSVEARKLGIPAKDLLVYLESAGGTATPALTAALKLAREEVEKLPPGADSAYQNLSDAAFAADDVRRQVEFTKTAIDNATEAMKPLNEQAKDLAYATRIAKEQAQGYADAAKAAYLRGDPAFGGGRYKTGRTTP
jgi:hypothetical protein